MNHNGIIFHAVLMVLSSFLGLKTKSKKARRRIARKTIPTNDLLQIFVKPSMKKSKVGRINHEP